ncbi:hypothetical protein FA13DRAFT_1709981 [Coprinellus micaceus]|uniref:Uncharacterized protein n=1 Tax=Coprinellus micaceus TaxID=71717 RepID=A0A4Y7TAW5_COPMI|nr:hypothetical protein FA13DRAFT_1709981 [Coprinellus micaceus]
MPDELNLSRSRVRLGTLKRKRFLSAHTRTLEHGVAQISDIILRTILTILEDESTPTRPLVRRGDQLFDAVEDTLPLRRVTGLVRLVTRVILEERVTTKTTSKSAFSDILEEYLCVVIRWFAFYIRAGSWTYAFNPHDTGDAPAFVAEHFYALYLFANTKLSTAIHASESAADLALTLFVSRNDEGVCHRKAEFSLTLNCPFVYLMSGFCMNPVGKAIIASKLACFTQANRRRFLDSAISRMRLWAAQRLRETDPSTTDHILRIIVLATDFLDVAGPQYRKA